MPGTLSPSATYGFLLIRDAINDRGTKSRHECSRDCPVWITGQKTGSFVATALIEEKD